MAYSKGNYDLSSGDVGAGGRLRKKLVVVGDGGCGKTCLLISFTQSEFNPHHIPTVFDTYVTDITVEGQKMELALWDTAGQEEYEILRPLSYPNTDIILLCFSVDNRDSFENSVQKWIPELRHYCPKTTIILVGTKIDLRPSPDGMCTEKGARSSKQIQPEEGHVTARCSNLYKYLECSSKTREGVQEVFNCAATAILRARDKSRKFWHCVLL